MLFLLFVPLIAQLSAGGASAAPAARVGEAEVRESSRGLPCFTIPEREERRSGVPDFVAITVYEPSVKPRARMWAMSMPANRTFPVSFSMCIPYAGRVQALPQTAAATLAPGQVYDVAIAVRAGGDTPNRPRSYVARFCLAKQGDGSVVVRQVDAGAHARRTPYGCVVPR